MNQPSNTTSSSPQWARFLGSEPRVRVGLACAEHLDFEPIGPFETVHQEGRVLYRPLSPQARMRVAINVGEGFHWQHTDRLTYSGAFELTAETDADGLPTGRLLLVNEVGVEEYLKSVISSEMKATASAEFMRTHAIISRSWLLRMMLAADGATGEPCHTLHGEAEVAGRRVAEVVRWYDSAAHSRFHVCCDDHCQRYHGIEGIRSAAAEAVEATRGVILTYGNEIVDARFSKCCGGRTELYENCWDPTPHPYLPSIADRLEEDTADLCDTADPALLAQVLTDFDRRTPDFHHWTVTYTAAELTALVGRHYPGVGTVENLIPLHRGPSGRITRLLIEGSDGSVVVGKELEIRYLLAPKCLYSSAFTVEKTTRPHNIADADSTADRLIRDTTFTLRGRGWGHGVGLCQIGAAHMGALGHTHTQILAHYFPSALLTRVY